MNTLNLSENIVRLRRQRGITQEELAEFVGVTKASVSKWETRQSMPDILLLPQLASFFDVTVDSLLGYEPGLGREQIQKIYHELASDFVQRPFEEVMEKSRKLVKKYYSCYPFLFQVCTLWLNHFALADGQESQIKVLAETGDLCTHIISGCKDLGICNDAVILKAGVDLQMGKAMEVIDMLEEVLNPYRISNQCDSTLIQAYRMAGQEQKADSFTQISMFIHLITLAAGGVQYLAIHEKEPEVCEETIRRMDCLMETFDLEHLHPNTAAIYHYQAAVIYCTRLNVKEALERLGKYVSVICYLLEEDHLKLRGDNYFYCLDEWFENAGLGSGPPRDRLIILESAIQTLDHPAFGILKQEMQFQHLKRVLTGEKMSG